MLSACYREIRHYKIKLLSIVPTELSIPPSPTEKEFQFIGPKKEKEWGGWNGYGRARFDKRSRGPVSQLVDRHEFHWKDFIPFNQMIHPQDGPYLGLYRKQDTLVYINKRSINSASQHERFVISSLSIKYRIQIL